MNMPRLLIAAAIALAAAAAGQSVAPASSQALAESEVYQAYNAFCLEYFGTENEPLVYEAFGDELRLREDSLWVHASRQSAAIGLATSLPARTVVEYGRTAELGESTAEDADERYFYTHLRQLRDLEPGQTYHYRVMGVDERGQRVALAAGTFETAAPAGATLIEALPEDGGPYRIDRPGYYLLTADIVADAGAFEIRANDVTLDLGGHTVVYNHERGEQPEGSHWDWMDASPMGVRVAQRRLQNVNIVNGTILQGAGNNGGQDHGHGANPISIMSGVTGSVAGVTLVWSGEQVRGLLSMSRDMAVHHNVLVDLGTEITNRHQGIAAISGAGDVHHNRVSRTRHRGIDMLSNATYYRNEVHVDSFATNASGMGAYRGQNVTVRDNRVFGGGYMPIGIAPLSATTADIIVADNLIHVQATAPESRWAEYGEQSSVAGFRMTWGGENVHVHDNLIIANARDGGMTRGIWYSPNASMRGNVIRDNIIKSIAIGESDDRGTIAINGSDTDEDVAPVTFANNRVISNYLHIRLADSYGAGHAARFVGNTFERVGERSGYRFVQIGYWRFHCINNRIVDPVFDGPVRHDMVRWEGGSQDAPRWFEIAWTVTVEASPGQAVRITDAMGDEVAAGRTDAEGRFAAELVEVRHENGEAIRHTPHTLNVGDVQQQITADRPHTLQIP